MALQGTLETFSVPEVLRLLANTRKTGLLALDGDRGVGNVWLREGSIVAARSDHERSGDIDAALFDLLRYGSGDFVFESDAEPEEPATDEIDVEAVLGRAETLLAEWRDLESVVPTLRVGVRLVQELAGESVSITAEQWQALAAIGGGTSAAGLGQRLELGELDTCRRIRDLVEASLVEITDDAAEPEPEPESAGPEPVADEPVAAPRTNGWDGDVEVVDHDLSSDEVASLGDNLAGFVAKPTDEPVESSAAPVDEWDHEGVDESAEASPDVDDPARSVAEQFDAAGTNGSEAERGADEFLAQLTNLSPKAAAAIEATAEEAAGRQSSTPETEETPTEPATSSAPEGDAEVNRNLLLKFVSSTKN